MKFSIPMKRDDLLQPPDDENDFSVRDVYSIRDLKTKLKDCELGVRKSGYEYVDKGGFEILFSVLVHFNKELPADCKENAYQILLLSMDLMEKDLDHVLAIDNQMLNLREKEKKLNQVKMTVYLFCQMMELFESHDSSASTEAIFAKLNKRKGKNSAFPVASVFWDQDMKQASVNQIYRFVHLNIALLFDPPVVEREFVNAIANTLFRFFENPSIAHQKNRDLRASLIQILGTFCERFSYGLSCRLKIVQSLRHFEHLALPMSEAINTITNEYNSPSIIMEVVRDISQIDPQELQRDTAATRAYSVFLSDLAERQPVKMKNCLSLLTVHLEGESYTMRKCVLTVIGEIILKVLNGDELDETSKESRDQLLDCLEDHVHDVHAFVRSSVLSVWSKLSVAKAIPLSRHQRVLDLVVGRLQDKSSNVRKQTVQLLTTLLEQNPYAASMPNEELAQRLEEEEKKLEDMKPQVEIIKKKREEEWETFKEEISKDQDDQTSEPDDKVWENATSKEVVARLRHLLEKRKFSRALFLLKSAQETFPDDELFGTSSQGEPVDMLKAIYVTPLETEAEIAGDNEDYNKQRVFVAYLQDCAAFAESLDKALPTVCVLLGSKVISDIKEAVRFFVSAHEFGVQKAMIGVRQMLSLIWSREKEVKDEVVSAYKELYIDKGRSERNAKAQAAFIVQNFIAWVNGATIGELTSLEELISMLVRSQDVDKECFQVLWQYFTKCSEDTTNDEAKAALTILGMIGNAEPNVIRANLELLIKHGFDNGNTRDFLMIHEACVALTKMSSQKQSQTEEAPLKFDSDNDIFTSLKTILIEGIKVSKDCYIPMSQKACTVIYQYAEQPDLMVGDIIKKICSNIPKELPSFFLKRLVSLVGHVAVSQLNYLDVSVLNELKRRKTLCDQKKEKMNKGRKSIERRKSRAIGEEQDEMDLIGAEADDADLEFIRKVCETEILNGENMLSLFAPLILNICRMPSKYPDPQLKTAASLALSKMMLISSDFCDQQLQLLFTVMEKSEEPVVRANLIIATGDLSFRFPNTLEPWTPRMYARLRDHSTLVRSNTLTVLTHLILNDMIKVKGQISNMALCIADEDVKIAGLSKHFFHELARKGNALYNVMPDIISRLSNSESNIPEDQFQLIMKYIISLIEKDKHLEALAEKLCHRFGLTQCPRQRRDIAFCLSLFNLNEKAVEKLRENFPWFSDKMQGDEIPSELGEALGEA